MRNILKSLLPHFSQIKKVVERASRAKSGSRLSKIGRYLVERANIRKIIGANATLIVAANILIPAPLFQESILQEPEQENVVLEVTSLLPHDKGIRIPTQKLVISQGFKFFHPGLDLDGVTGDPIYAIAKGVIIATDNSRYAYGNAILIDHGQGVSSLYAHLSKIEVSEGDFVTTETEIGKMGSTGRSSGDHLHLEIRRNGIPINPLSILPR